MKNCVLHFENFEFSFNALNVTFEDKQWYCLSDVALALEIKSLECVNILKQKYQNGLKNYKEISSLDTIHPKTLFINEKAINILIAFSPKTVDLKIKSLEFLSNLYKNKYLLNEHKLNKNDINEILSKLDKQTNTNIISILDDIKNVGFYITEESNKEKIYEKTDQIHNTKIIEILKNINEKGYYIDKNHNINYDEFYQKLDTLSNTNNFKISEKVKNNGFFISENLTETQKQNITKYIEKFIDISE